MSGKNIIFDNEKINKSSFYYCYIEMPKEDDKI